MLNDCITKPKSKTKKRISSYLASNCRTIVIKTKGTEVGMENLLELIQQFDQNENFICTNQTEGKLILRILTDEYEEIVIKITDQIVASLNYLIQKVKNNLPLSDYCENHSLNSSCRIKQKGGQWIKGRLQVKYFPQTIFNNQDNLTGIIENIRCKYNHNEGTVKYITKREKEVLQLIGNGESSKIIADKLNISETTAISHRKNLIQKLHVKNTAELIKKAVKENIID